MQAKPISDQRWGVQGGTQTLTANGDSESTYALLSEKKTQGHTKIFYYYNSDWLLHVKSKCWILTLRLRKYKNELLMQHAPRSPDQKLCHRTPLEHSPRPPSTFPTAWSVLFCFSAVFDLRVGHTTNILSPFVSVLYHSEWLFHGESCPCLDVVHLGCASSFLPACTWHCSLHCLFLKATALFPHGVTIVC